MKTQSAVWKCLAILATLLLPTQAPLAEEGKLRVGFMLPYSGTYASLGHAITNGFKQHVDELGGKIAGRTVEYVTVDDESDPAKATENAGKLIKRDKVDVIVGTVHSGVALALTRVARETNTLLINPNAGADEITGALSESIDLTTSHDERPIALQIRALKRGAIDIIGRNWDPERQRLMLGEFPAKNGKQAELTVYTRVDDDVKLVSAKSEHEAVTVAWEKDEQFQSKAGKTRRYRLKISVPPAAPVLRQREQAEKIDLTFDHPKLGTIRILVDYLSI